VQAVVFLTPSRPEVDGQMMSITKKILNTKYGALQLNSFDHFAVELQLQSHLEFRNP